MKMRNLLHGLMFAITSFVCILTTANAWAMYDPGTGRFVQRDPLGYPDGMNTYAAYHVMRGGVDPSGQVYGCVGVGVGGTAFVPVIGIAGLGLGGQVALYECGTLQTPCIRACAELNLAPMFGTGFFLGGGAAFNIKLGWANLPNGQPQAQIAFGLGGGVAMPNVPAFPEITVDVSSSDVSISIGKGGPAAGAYIAIRVSVSCFACGNSYKDFQTATNNVYKCAKATANSVGQALGWIQKNGAAILNGKISGVTHKIKNNIPFSNDEI